MHIEEPTPISRKRAGRNLGEVVRQSNWQSSKVRPAGHTYIFTTLADQEIAKH